MNHFLILNQSVNITPTFFRIKFVHSLPERTDTWYHFLSGRLSTWHFISQICGTFLIRGNSEHVFKASPYLQTTRWSKPAFLHQPPISRLDNTPPIIKVICMLTLTTHAGAHQWPTGSWTSWIGKEREQTAPQTRQQMQPSVWPRWWWSWRS